MSSSWANWERLLWWWDDDDDDDYLDFIGATIPLETIYKPTPISI